MKNSLSSSLIFLLFIGCNNGHYKKLSAFPATPDTKPAHLKPLFEDSFNSFLFKANIRLYTKTFSGLLVTKQIEPKNYRVILTSEFGMKLFDFEFKDTSFKVQYCVSQFNQPVVLKTIKKDIEILLMNRLDSQSGQILTDQNKQFTIYRVNDEKDFNYFFIENASGKLTKIEHAGKRKKKIIFTLNDYHENFPDNILIAHRDIQLKIELSLLKNQP